jgi:predicted extracellular nuclease
MTASRLSREQTPLRFVVLGALVVTTLMLMPPTPARALVPITQWTFDGDVTTPSTGGGTASLVGGATASFVNGLPGRAWSTATYPPQGTGDRTRGAQFTVNTAGYSNVTFSYNEYRSNTAANTSVVQYSTDGLNFTDVQTFTVNAGVTWFTRTVDLSAIGEVNDAQSLTLRIVTAFASGTLSYTAANPGSNYLTAGAIRYDNVTISGDIAGDVPPVVSSATPANNASGVPLNSDVAIAFSESVYVSGNWFAINCASSGNRDANNTLVNGGPVTFTINPNVDFAAGESCALTVFAANVADQDGTPNNMAAVAKFNFSTASCSLPFTPIYTVQGTTASSQLSGTVQSVQGVVVGDYEGPSPNLRGFYLQASTGDSNPATSDGIFVFNFNNNSITLGSVVSVTGQVQEFQGQTQIGSVSGLEVCGTGSVAPTDVTLPFSSADYPERYEGMLVRFPQTLYVTEHFQLGRFGQIVASANDRLRQPTQIAAPGAPALVLQAQNNLNQIIVDDARNEQNPDPVLFGRSGNALSAANTLRGGDTFSNAVGVLTYNWAGNSASPNAYRLRPINALGGGVPNFIPSNPRPTVSPPVSGTLKVASINLLNFFNTFGDGNCTFGVGGGATDCRGAENINEFNRQVTKTVSNVVGTGADVVGIVEIENDGYSPDSAIQTLVNALNAATAPNTYAFIDADAQTGQVNALGSDAIKVGFLYKPASVTPVSNTAVLNTGAFGVFSTTQGAIQRSRPALAQAFQHNATSDVVIVSINHLKSKGSSCADNISPVGPDPDAGDGQGNCNLTRKAAAQEMAAWLATNPTGSTDPDVLIIGDLNSYAKEDPITALVNAGYVNLVEQKIGAYAYSYAFDGQWGYLDHALASDSLTEKVAEVVEWHINADEPGVLDYNTNFKSAGQQAILFAPDAFRSSDHDPVIVGIHAQVPETPMFFVHLPLIAR